MFSVRKAIIFIPLCFICYDVYSFFRIIPFRSSYSKSTNILDKFNKNNNNNNNLKENIFRLNVETNELSNNNKNNNNKEDSGKECRFIELIDKLN